MGDALATAVISSLAEMDLQPCDTAATELALTYAEQIDDGGAVDKLGPALLTVLESLGMTPRARAALMKKGEASAPQQRSPLDELRARREQRATG